MTRAARPARLLVGLVRTVAPALILMLAAAPSTALGQGARDPFEAMSVQRPAEPIAAPDLAFLTVEGREVRLSEVRGKVVLLGFFTTTRPNCRRHALRGTWSRSSSRGTAG
jgi:hypothetical protein